MKAFRYYLALCGLTLIMTAAAFAQPDSLWSRTFGGSREDECRFVQQTADGGYILGGSTESYGAGCFDFWLMKTDADGDSLWSRTFGQSNYDICYSVQQTSDGGYILGGKIPSYGTGGWDFWLVKTDANGDSLWSHTYRGIDNETCHSIQQTADGGYILGGTTESYVAGSSDIWLVKVDANGDSLWGRTFGGSDYDRCYSVQQITDGGYVLGGSTSSYGAGSGDFWLVKTDTSGIEEWNRTFGGSDYDRCYSVQQTTDGGYILAGYTKSFGAGDYDFWLVKTDANGDSLWSRTFGGDGNELCLSVQQTLGGYVLAGYTTSYGAGDADFWLVKTDVNGDSLWDRTFGGSSWDVCYSIQQTSGGGYIIGGVTQSYGAGSSDFWLVKTGPELAAEPIISPLPDKYVLQQNYPNPFNPSTQISFDLTKASHVSLRVFDVLGREVRALVNDVQPSGTHSITFDGTGLPSGIYLYRFQVGDFVTTKKMVLLK